MKYLSDYTEEAQTALFEELGVFFAFSTEQFEEGKKKFGHLKHADEKWASMGMGMYLPSHNADECVRRLNNIQKEGIEKDLAENGREGVLQRELGNYEIGLSWEGINDTNFRNGISGYGFTEEEIKAAYKKHMEENEY